MRNVIKTGWIAAALCGMTTAGYAQFKGDDDGILMQKAASRDSLAIAEAVDGWWTASMKDHEQRIAWWREARFGCFIHWGVYSVPGGEWKGKKVGGYAEHLMRKEKISRSEYAKTLIAPFNPTAFNAEEWVKLIKEAGMRYLIITAKHHDGVAMYPSAIGDYTISQSAFKRDPMAELAAACKKAGIRFGFYYSHAFDWEHPDAPGNDWDYNNPGGDKNLFGGTNWYDHHPELLPKAVKYVNEKSIPQIQELLRKYHPDIIWFDTPHKLPLSENIRILQAIRAVDQNVVVNGRLARSSSVSFGDYKNTADRPAEFYPVTGDWEAIPTTNESYGYSRYDMSHKPLGFFIRLMAKATSRSGNLLMNIGPMGNGVIDPRDTVILHGIGQWVDRYGASIYGAGATGMPLQSWGVTTAKGGTKYLHVFDWPANGKLVVNGLTKINSASLMGAQQKLVVKKTGDAVWEISLPKQAPDKYNCVIVINDGDAPVRSDLPRILDLNGRPQQLLAFDAQQRGKGFGFGDGKTDRYYVNRWKETSQALSWTFLADKSAECSLNLRYVIDATSGGRYAIKVDGVTRQTLDVLPAPAKGEEVKTQTAANLTLTPGVHTLEIVPEKVTGEELMKLLEITLTPVKQ